MKARWGTALGLSCAFAGALFGFKASAQTVAITGGKVVIGDGSDPVDGATVLVQDGKVIAVGRDVVVPAGVRKVDASGKWVTPGLVVAITDLGLIDVEAVDDSNDSAAGKSPFSASLDLSQAINPDAQHIKVSRSGGVTRAAVAPIGTDKIFGGQGAVIDLGADPNPVMVPRAFQYVELGETGASRAGGSRVATWAELHNSLGEARELSAVPMGSRRDDVLLNRRDAAALIPVVTGKQPLYVHVERAADIRMVLKLRQEYPAIRLVIVGATEGWMVSGELAQAGVPVLATPLNDLPASFEQLGATQSNVGRMKAAGVKVSLGAFFDQPRYAPQYAGNMVALAKVPGASGLSWNQAFASISSGPAEAMGLGDKIGSLRPGRMGDVVIWDGDPLEVTSGVTMVFIDGVEQPMKDHQTRLRDRYKTSPTEGALPKAYDW